MRTVRPAALLLLLPLWAGACTRFAAGSDACPGGNCRDLPVSVDADVPDDLSLDAPPDPVADPGPDLDTLATDQTTAADAPVEATDRDATDTGADLATDPSPEAGDAVDAQDLPPDVPPDLPAPDVPDTGPDTGPDTADLPAADVPSIGVGGACSIDSDCRDGVCVPWDPGVAGSPRVCTGPCTGGCPDGLECLPTGEPGTTTCRPFPGGLCAACEEASDCPVEGDQCIPMPGGTRHCTTPCPAGTCPIGFTCTAPGTAGIPEDQPAQCLPSVGDCRCTEDLAGRAFPCGIDNGFGTCNGVRLCAPAGGWSACSSRVPSAERCNREDDDCNGTIDEGFAYEGQGLGAACEGTGECGPGRVECSFDGARATCSTNFDGSASEAIPETCNGRDDDCDGRTDDGMLYAGQPVGALCMGAGTCGLGRVECNPATRTATCSTNPDGTDPRGQPEVCDGLDNDCNGHVDDGVVASVFDCRRKGLCDGHILPAACVKGAWVCDYSGVPGFETVETRCDGIDSDCDGLTDEEFPLGEACDGPDKDQCKHGIYACSADHRGVTCGPETVTDLVETCNGLDDDCDGRIDENFPAGEFCDGADADSCAQGTFTCLADGTGVECVNEPVPPNPSTIEFCDGLDNDCNGTVDDPWPLKGLPCDAEPVAPIACRTGLWACDAAGTGLECTGHTDCAAGSTCEPSGQPSAPDRCVCGSPAVTCTSDTASECTIEGSCRCGSGSPCTGARRCVLVDTEYTCQ